MGQPTCRRIMLLPQDGGSDGDDSITQDYTTDDAGSDDSCESDTSSVDVEREEGLRRLVERLGMWGADMEALPWHARWDLREGHDRPTEFKEFVQWQLRQAPDIKLFDIIECLKSDVVCARGLLNSLTVHVMPTTRALARRRLQYGSYVPTIHEGSLLRIDDVGFWKPILPLPPRQPCLRFPPWESIDKVKMDFHWCGVPDLAGLVAADEGDPDEGSRQLLGLLHVLHYLSLARDEHEVFTTAVGRALVKRSWQQVRWYYWVHTFTGVLFIVLLGVVAAASKEERDHVSRAHALLTFVMFLMSTGSFLGDLAELWSFELEFGRRYFKRNFFVWNLLCLGAETIVFAIQCHILWCYATGSNMTFPGFLPYTFRASLLTFVAIFKFYMFSIYIMIFDIFAHSIVPAYLALTSFDSVAFLILLGLANVAATHGFWTLPTNMGILDAYQLMFRLATVGDSDAVIQTTEEGDGPSHIIKRIYVLFVLGIGSVCAMNLYFGILFNAYQKYKQRWVHHYLKWLAQMMIKFLLRLLFLNRLLRGDAGFEPTDPAEFNPLFKRADTQGQWIVWCPSAQPTVTTLGGW
mmetsp:Transcript_23980/g.67363  ORF Transcript_23980/g.67363 Transcript_23980/m.67363 type:complete len:578 (-) Transcript_23980:22-1755(-)